MVNFLTNAIKFSHPCGTVSILLNIKKVKKTSMSEINFNSEGSSQDLGSQLINSNKAANLNSYSDQGNF